MEEEFIGREKETAVLEKLYKSKKAEFLAVYGRRRVGKTWLVSHFFQGKGVYFELTGTKDASKGAQLFNFTQGFSDCFFQGKPQKTFRSWQHAFAALALAIKESNREEKIVIFFDELPWLASKKS